MRLGIWDSPRFDDPWVTIAEAAAATTKIAVGTNVTNPITCDPSVVARALRTLDSRYPGRIFMGIGCGGTAVRLAGLNPARVDQLRDFISAIRQLLATGRAVHTGCNGNREIFIGDPARHPIPILVAAHGPLTLQLASTIGDGVIIGRGLTQQVIDDCAVRLSDHKASTDDFEICWNPAAFSVGTNPGDAEAELAWTIAQQAHHLCSAVEANLVPKTHRQGVQTLGNKYQLHLHGNAATTASHRKAYLAAAEELDVCGYLADRCLILGTEDQVVERLHVLWRRGIRRLAVSGFGEPDRLARCATAVARFNREIAS